MTVKFEYELNRMWIYTKDSDDPIGEVNFVVSGDWLNSYWEAHKTTLHTKANDLDTFLAAYIAEEDGCEIYQAAMKDGAVTCEFNTFYEQ